MAWLGARANLLFAMTSSSFFDTSFVRIGMLMKMSIETESDFPFWLLFCLELRAAANCRKGALTVC